MAICGFLRKHAHALFRFDYSRTAGTISGTASTSVVSPDIIAAFERSEMPRLERRMHSLSKIRKRMARLHDHESHLDQINEFYICAAI
ncbi:hypothetical protein, partial [Mesorhizobium sp. M1A.F.Ca.IN.020.03.1.1]|uniref:hypothetical protein n=1 Tax=Mesorhizobium sp. M1A.F.Ca.IN.020.03.1.1 TaxID=2496764 RepID=UPI0019D22C8B